jgi:ectoine hydroxylase-related dioxygenase (phytanoyl-CoA dioxygenase family)
VTVAGTMAKPVNMGGMSRDAEPDRAALSEAQRYRWECNGFLVLPDVLSAAELEGLRAAADDHFARFRSEYRERSPGTFQHASLLEGTDAFDALIWHPGVAGIVDDLLGGDATFVETSLILKQPGTRTHAGWHRDIAPAMVYHPASTLAVSAIYYLTDVEPHGGPFAVVPGSHKFPLPLPKLDDLEQMPHFERLAAAAGTVILFHGALWHAAMHNASDRRRLTIHQYYVHRWMKTTGHTKIPERLYGLVAGDPFQARLLYRP